MAYLYNIMIQNILILAEFYCEKIKVLKAGSSLNNKAWNNKIRLDSFYWYDE